MSLPLEAKQALGKFKSGVADLEKALNSQGLDGSGPNFAVAGIALAITEPIAKICYPYIYYQDRTITPPAEVVRLGYRTRTTNLRNERGRPIRQDVMRDIRADRAVEKLWRNHFANKKYAQYGNLVWDCFRNGITHLQLPQKIVNTPHVQHDNSFLTGVTWIGRLADLNLPTDMAAAKNEHLNFKIEKVRGKDRPAFIFSPHVYYFDLKKALADIEKQTATNAALQARIVTGWEIFCRSYKTDFSVYEPALRSKIDHEIRRLK
ncbi:MAG: hypothetical protein U5L95_01395 [Candidatus Saccharibacteria bacterium]|nr:hypothetical protein [Candidatus Saccharibacteria bacterium]